MEIREVFKKTEEKVHLREFTEEEFDSLIKSSKVECFFKFIKGEYRVPLDICEDTKKTIIEKGITDMLMNLINKCPNANAYLKNEVKHKFGFGGKNPYIYPDAAYITSYCLLPLKIKEYER
ncbi:hypothetical protein KAU11_09105 [Candidatus Babeliales bacterium]|nr:hypothetical protein [Candidatus Babeliales bacterium]